MAHNLFLAMALLAAGPPQAAQTPPRETAKSPEPALLAEYNAQRDKAPSTADAHWKLALWCERKGLKDQALAEFAMVTQLDPRRDAAWKKLGLVKREGRWTTVAQLAADRAEAEAQRKADAHWRPLLLKSKNARARKDKRALAEAALEVMDPRAVPSIWKVFATGKADDQERAIDMLGKIEGERASAALAGLALFGNTDPVRRAAVETLTRRNADDVLISWIGLLRPPIKYEVRQVAGPGLPGVLMVEGEQFNFRRFYAPPTDAETASVFVLGASAAPLTPQTWQMEFSSNPATRPPLGSRPAGEWNGTPLYIFDYTWAPPPSKYPDPTKAYQVFERNQIQAQIDRDFTFEETAKMAAGAQAQLRHDVNVVEQANATIRERNARLAEALRRVSGKDLGEDREAWLKWWMTKRGYTYIPPKDRPKTTVDMQVPLPYVPASGPPVAAAGSGGGGGGGSWCMLWEHDKGQQPRWGKCFAADTPVLTPDGDRTIETLRAGDRVVTGHGPDGIKRTASILSVHHAQAEHTLRLVVGGEVIVTTDGHPFRKPASGWTRAGDLKPGDDIVAINGPARIEAIEVQPGAMVWNLRLAGSPVFVVGRCGLLVHDISPVADVSATSDIQRRSRAATVSAMMSREPCGRPSSQRP